MSLEKNGYIRPGFRIRRDINDKLKMYLLKNDLGSVSKYVENAVLKELKKDGIISQDDKNWFYVCFLLTLSHVRYNI